MRRRSVKHCVTGGPSLTTMHAAHSSAPPQVILVGSHADLVKSTGGSVQEKMTEMSALLKQLPASFHFAGQVAFDCRKL